MNANIEEAYATEAERIAAQLDGIASLQYPDENLPSRFRIDLPKAGVNDAAFYLHFSPYSAKGRIVVGCLYPTVKALGHTVNVPGNFLDASALESLGYVPKITVALYSTAQQVAASVKRRLLPGYLGALAAVHQGNADAIDRQNRRTARVQRLASVAGVTLSEQSLASERFSRWHQPTGRSLEVDSSGGDVSISLNYVTPEIAEKAIALFVNSLPKGA